MNKNEILKRIIELEYQMFEKVRASNKECKDRPNTFKITREARFYPFSEKTLLSYLKDLKDACQNGRNLLEEKYARMDNLIPPLPESSLIKKIVEIEVRWVKELREKYPFVFSFNTEKFSAYLKAELETFSFETLQLYFKDVVSATGQGINLAEVSYNYLFTRIGMGTLEELNKRRKRK